MRKTLVILFAGGSSFAATMGDFAPTEIGTTWEYSYYYEQSYVSTPVNKDSLEIRIELLSKKAAGADTIISLSVRERGRSVRWADENGIRLADTVDTLSDVQYVDTAIVSGDSIYPQPGYRCKVFPFWKTHTIEADSVSRLSSGTDSLNCIILKYGQISIDPGLVSLLDKAVYLQNTGLTWSLNNQIGNRHKATSIKLLSFNGQPVPTEIRQASNMMRRKFPAPMNGIAKTVLMQQRINVLAGAFSLSGKKIPTGIRMAPGLAIMGAGRQVARVPVVR